MWHIFRLFVVCLFTLSLFCILKWNFYVMKISRQRHQLLIAWQADGDSCIGSPHLKCCNSATPTRRRRRPRCEIAYVSYKTCKYLSGYAKKRKRKSRKRMQINWLRFALSKRDRGAKRLSNLGAAAVTASVVVVVILCGWQITVAKTVENSIKLRANNRRRSILVDVVYIILLFAITEKQRQAQQCHNNNNSRNTRTTSIHTHTHTNVRTVQTEVRCSFQFG